MKKCIVYFPISDPQVGLRVKCRFASKTKQFDVTINKINTRLFEVKLVSTGLFRRPFLHTSAVTFFLVISSVQFSLAA
jgi:hypothetical protein